MHLNRSNICILILVSLASFGFGVVLNDLPSISFNTEVSLVELINIALSGIAIWIGWMIAGKIDRENKRHDLVISFLNERIKSIESEGQSFISFIQKDKLPFSDITSRLKIISTNYNDLYKCFEGVDKNIPDDKHRDVLGKINRIKKLANEDSRIKENTQDTIAYKESIEVLIEDNEVTYKKIRKDEIRRAINSLNVALFKILVAIDKN